MAKKIDSNEKRRNYNIERIRQPMDRSELDKIYRENKSEDDYVNYHLELVEDTPRKNMVTIMNVDSSSPVKNSNEDRSYGYMKPTEALEFLTNYIDEGKTNGKAKHVMQSGFGKKSVDKYKELVRNEEEEGFEINGFTKPTFEDILNNNYVNVYNGSTYNEKESDLPDDLREDVGVIIPGLIESKEEYFEFVKRLKDRGKNGLGRAVYDRYEDYIEAVDLIETYRQAIFNKYGGKEEFFCAKDMGGIFGAYEYYPTIKPRFKKTSRNIKLDRGINLNPLALVEDMGRRIRDELDEEIDCIEVNHDYTFYENTPPKFIDLPEDLKMFYTKDKNDFNGFSITDNFMSLDTYATKLIATKDPDKQYEGYRIKEMLENERIANLPEYESTFVSIADEEDLPVDTLISQLEFDKLMYENGNNVEYVNSVADNLEIIKAFKAYVKDQIIELNGWEPDDTRVNKLVNYAYAYTFDERFRKEKDEESKLNSVVDVLYREQSDSSYEFNKDDRVKYRAGENKLQAYVRELSNGVRDSLSNMYSDADNINKQRHDRNVSTVDLHDITGAQTLDSKIQGFDIGNDPDQLLKYMKDLNPLAKKIYEISSDTQNADEVFSERIGIDEFLDNISEASNPMITEFIINKNLKSCRKGE